jgi:mono/diheme cytochrome c family protein
MLLLITTVPLGAGVATSLAAQQTRAAVPPVPAPGFGETLYVRVGCASCHGLSGVGSIMTGPPLARTRLPYEIFSQLVRSPLKNMPPYTTKVLPEEDLQQIYNQLLEIPEPITTAAEVAKAVH